MNQTAAPSLTLRHNRTRSGFSLLEMLVVLAIAGTMLAVAVPAFMDYMRAFRLRAASNQLVNDMNLARQTAITRNRDVYVFLRPTSGPLNTNYEWDADYDVVISNLQNGIAVTGAVATSMKGWPVQALSAQFVRVVSGGSDKPSAATGTSFPDEDLDDIQAKDPNGGGAIEYDYAGVPAVVFRPNGSVKASGAAWVTLPNTGKGTRFDWYQITVSPVGKVGVAGGR